MSSVVRDKKKSIGLLPEAQLKWLQSRGGLILIVCPNCDEHGWLRIYDYRTFKMLEEQVGAKSIKNQAASVTFTMDVGNSANIWYTNTDDG